MNEPTFLGIAKSQWEFYNSFAVWLSAIGTLAAVIVSLYLSLKTRPRAKVSASLMEGIGFGGKAPHPEFVVIQVVNIGDHNLRITHFAWKVGFGKVGPWKKRFLWMPNIGPFPKDLSHGEDCQISLDAKEEWFVDFAKKILMPHYRFSCFTLRAQVSTSTGYVFESKPTRRLMAELKATCKNLGKNWSTGSEKEGE
jgi:hypothetical protein